MGTSVAAAYLAQSYMATRQQIAMRETLSDMISLASSDVENVTTVTFGSALDPAKEHWQLTEQGLMPCREVRPQDLDHARTCFLAVWDK